MNIKSNIPALPTTKDKYSHIGIQVLPNKGEVSNPIFFLTWHQMCIISLNHLRPISYFQIFSKIK